MLKIVSIVSGLLTFGLLCSSSLAIKSSHQTPRVAVQSKLYGQRLTPIKKSVDLKSILINTQPTTKQKPNSRQIAKPAGGFKNEQARIACEKELLIYQSTHGFNERPDPSIPNIGKPDNSDTSNGCHWGVSW